MNYEELIDDHFSGVISVRRDGEVVFQKAYGYADLPNQVMNQIDTKFATASAGKAFVAVAILQLIDEGKLRFEDRLGDVLRMDLNLLNRGITIEQLLDHTSGIPDYFDESVMDNYDELWQDYPNYKIRSSADLLPLFINKPMMYPPGERFQYNNSGYVMLGLVIEEKTGMRFDEYLQKVVFNPCGMTDTGYYELDRLPARCANAYIYDSERQQFYTNIYSVDAKGTGAGGAFTTVMDIHKFWDGLLGGKLISSEMVSNMLNLHSSDGSARYGYGMWLIEAGDHFIPFFQGCDPGVSFVSTYSLKQKLNITIASNFGSDVWDINEKILKQYK
ncbi:serine hydrolase [Paenibacillus dokdonensis]|uniref:Serine hydrolase n=1 Tax=Paenibacillus dokdonensis TaxID=2567944 RepID=A0ABU6GEW7_9BACL|nr:serine hydrolase domain-containing protein [Paenibacillus dokdonensis]MEC0238280.1 serine hydrolase [Paenibacillus dokdonensis]